jgi:hypothetical protein
MERIASSNVVPNLDKTNIENFPLATPKCKFTEQEFTDSQQREVTGPGGCVGPYKPST